MILGIKLKISNELDISNQIVGETQPSGREQLTQDVEKGVPYIVGESVT